MIALLVLTSAAIVVHFLRVRTAGVWRGTVAPVLALLALGTILVLVVGNFDLLIGSHGLADMFLAVLATAFLSGLVWAVALHRNRPDVYATLE